MLDRLARVEWVKCSRCGAVRDEDHDWSRNCEYCARCGATRASAHAWRGCTCTVCGDTRADAHAWSGCMCTFCGNTRDIEHHWNGCTCAVCSKTRDEGHQWDGCKCTACKKLRDRDHQWMGWRCSKCGKNARDDAVAEVWEAFYVIYNGPRTRTSDETNPDLAWTENILRHAGRVNFVSDLTEIPDHGIPDLPHVDPFESWHKFEDLSEIKYAATILKKSGKRDVLSALCCFLNVSSVAILNFESYQSAPLSL
jgi:hypothetical protein